MAAALVLLWCAAGLTGLYRSGVGPARGAAAAADAGFAAVLGPFALLISALAVEMTVDACDEPDARGQPAER